MTDTATGIIERVRDKAKKLLALMRDAGDMLESYLYLLHHVHLNDNGTEELHHCFVLDHLGNKFTVDHIKGADGNIYHAIIGLEDDQVVFWSEEEAEAAGCTVPCANRQL